MDIKRALNGQTPEIIYNQLMRSNPQFRDFIEANKNKSPEQIAREYGVDFNDLQQLLR